MKKDIFRKVMLDRLSSPEQLDQLMTVTRPRAWLVLSGIGLLLVSFIVWSVMGQIPTKVHGTGILIHTAGLTDVVTTHGGQVMDIFVDRGDRIKAGEVVATLAQPELEKDVFEAKSKLEELKSRLDRSREMDTEEIKLQGDMTTQRKAAISIEIQSLSEQIKWLDERLRSQERLHAKGLVTKQILETTKLDLQVAKDKQRQLRAQRKQVQFEGFETRRETQEKDEVSESGVRSAERKLAFLEERLQAASTVVATHSGRVMELRAMAGKVVNPGTPILSMELEGEEHYLDALLYVPSDQGKKIKKGMTVQVVPSVVKRAEFGVVEATVNDVAEFPSTRTGMMRVLENEELVNSFLKEAGGAPIAVQVKLSLNPNAPSGYRWSSGTGPDILMTSGTPCEAWVQVSTQRPVSFLFPGIEGRLGF